MLPGRTKREIQAAWRMGSWVTGVLAGLWGLLAVVGFAAGDEGPWLPVVWLAMALVWAGASLVCRRRAARR